MKLGRERHDPEGPRTGAAPKTVSKKDESRTRKGGHLVGMSGWGGRMGKQKTRERKQD